VQFDTKIAIIVREDLEAWQKLNVTAFTVSGIASLAEVLGEPYEDGSGRRYLPMIRQPILVFAATSDELRQVYDRAAGTEAAFRQRRPPSSRDGVSRPQEGDGPHSQGASPPFLGHRGRLRPLNYRSCPHPFPSASVAVMPCLPCARSASSR
jgi:hypothetical protein